MAKSASEKGLFPHLRYAAKSDVGRKRENNEDAFGTFPASGIYCVADGMGGGDDGEVASAAVVDAIRRFTKECPLPREYTYPIDGMVSGISKSLNAASAWVAKRTQEKGLKGCGSTFVGICFDAARPDVAVALHAGDSRLYRIRGKSIVQMTKDHSAAGLIGAKSERDVNPMFRGMVLRAVGVQPSVELERTPLPLKEGDRILICSDGLSRMVRDKDMAAIVRNAATLDAAVDGLIAAANEAGGIDNVTAVLVGVGPLPPPLPTSRPTDAATVQAMTAGGELTATQSMTTFGTVAETETTSIDFDFVPTTAGDGREDETMATLAVTDSDTEEHAPLQSTAEDVDGNDDDRSPFQPQMEKTWSAILRDRRIIAAVAIALAATCATAIHLSMRSSAKAAATLAMAEQERHRILQKETRQGIKQRREEEQLAAEAKRKAEEEAKDKAEAERIERERVAAEEAKRKAEEEAKAKAEAEARAKAEAEAKAKAERIAAEKKREIEEAKRKAEEKAKAEAAARAKAEAEASAKAEAERRERERIAAEEKRKAEEAAAKAEEERKERERIAAEEKRKAEETAARAKAEAEARAKAEEERKERERVAAEKKRLEAEAAARAKAEAEAKAKAEEERKERERIVADKKRREAEAVARAKAEAEAKRRAEEEAKTNAGAKRNVKTSQRTDRKRNAEAKTTAKTSQKATVKTGRAKKAVDELADVLKGTQLEAFMGKCTNYISEEMFNRFNMVRSSLSGRDVSAVIKDVKDVVRRLSYDTSLIVTDIEEELRSLPKKKSASLRKRERRLSEEWARKKDFIWKADAFLKTDLKTDKSYVDCVKKCAEMIRRIPEWLK